MPSTAYGNFHDFCRDSGSDGATIPGRNTPSHCSISNMPSFENHANIQSLVVCNVGFQPSNARSDSDIEHILTHNF